MADKRHVVDREDVRRFARDVCFAPGTDRVGAEIEFFTLPANPLAHADFPTVEQATQGPLPGGSRVTFEPGGQVELSSATFDDLSSAIDALSSDLTAITSSLGMHGIGLLGQGIDQMRPERRVLFAPRYDAMEAFFDVDGLSGRTMMCRTAAIQVNLDFGPTEETARARWRLAHTAGPVMAAAFANSPLWCGAPSGWASTRLATWAGIDRSRTAPVGGDGSDAWARYMLDARVMLVRRSEQDFVPVLEPFTLERWIDGGHTMGWPTLEDVEYHATTLFPPVRPRGWLEIRMCDALPDPWWQVPVAVWTAMLYNATVDALEVTKDCGSLWREGARDGLTHPNLRDAAVRLFDIAAGALRGTGFDPAVIEEYSDRYVRRGRTPGDELLDDQRQVELAWT